MSAYEEAERRLGRQLTDSERRIDLIQYDHDLERGKQKLYKAIEAEKARVIKARLKGRRARMKVTRDMVEALVFLHRRGIAHAHEELRKAGIEPSRKYASRRELQALGGLLDLLRQLLTRVTRRVEIEIIKRRKALDVDLSTAVIASLARAMEKQVPGSLSVAADLVSTAMAGGLEEGFEQDAELFETWEYSAVMDGATCTVCREYDGTVYPSWAAIMAVLPNGGPNPLCLGNGRCRCRPVPGKVKIP